MKKNSILACVLAGALLLSGCSNTAASGSAGKYTAGTYEATAQGYGGSVTVTMTVDADSITDVKAVGENETEGVGSKAIEQLPGAILEAQSCEVDGIAR